MVLKGFTIDKGSLLGKGQYSVYLATKHGRKYAAKFLHDKEVDDLKENELFLFHHGHGHPNILQVENYCQAEGIGSWIFTEYCQYGNLINYGEIFSSDFKKNETKLNIMKQVALGLEFLHSQNKIHRDVKPGNILVAEDEYSNSGIVVKLSDFGESKNLDRTVVATVSGTPHYAAPEMFASEQKSRQNNKVDIFSLGLTFLAMIQNSPSLIPIGDELRQSEFIGHKLSGKPSYRPVTVTYNDDSFTKAIKEIILNTLTYEPHRRLSAQDLVQQLEGIHLQPKVC